MKRITFVLVLLSAISLASRAQEVKPIESSIEDYIALLNQNGYQAYSFDISPMKDTTYQVHFEVREYVADNPEPVSIQPLSHSSIQTIRI
ncbi:MAG: hypothetical protein IKY16_11275 [Bacteroidales bacterium]|nr:hypothetical protein [Bacteroidales bacterium]